MAFGGGRRPASKTMEASDPHREFSRARRLIVDAYCLQHPEQYMKSTKSAAAHLAAMCWSLEYDRAENLHPALKLLLDGPRTFVRVPPPPPLRRGTLTIRHMLDVEDPDVYAS